MSSRVRPTGRRKSIYDPVHGPIALEGPSLALVGTPEFQRLWGIRQTGLAHLVFPGANHTRLEHSLGSYWVTSRLSEQLSLGDADSDRIAAGALLHDIGHGPFSHTLDGPMLEVLGVPHERLSCLRIEGKDPDWPSDRVEVPNVLERFGIPPASVARLIDPREPPRARRLLRAILHGPIDADRIDYLQRDAYYTGVAYGAIDAVRLLDTVRAVDARMAFAEKGRSAVEGFLVGRALMYSTVYFHKTVRAAEMMAQGAVERMDGYPDAARPLFFGRDAELLVHLREAGALSRSLVEGLLDRRLYKRAFGWRSVEPAVRARWNRAISAPAERRRMEDEIADRVGAPAGSVLLDLSGLVADPEPGDDWGEVAVEVGGELTFPFRGGSPWRTLADRSPSEWAVSVYASRRWAGAVARRLSRDPGLVP